MIVVLLLGGGTGTGFVASAPAPETVPEPNYQALLPANFTTKAVKEVALTGQSVKERAVVSEGRDSPPSQDLQVLQWKPTTRQWMVAFDARKVKGPGEVLPILTYPTDNIDLDRFFKARLDFFGNEQLIFGANVGTHYFRLGILGFKTGRIQIVGWFGFDHAPRIDLVGQETSQRLDITDAWVSPADAECCAVRNYHIVVDIKSGTYSVISDDRPYLGVWLANLAEGPTVESVDPGSPADGALQPGDVLRDLDGKPNPKTLGSPGFVDAVALHHPDDVVAVHFMRAGIPHEVTVRLNSLTSSLVDRPPFGFHSLSRSYIGIDGGNGNVGGAYGYVIRSVAPGSPAAVAGLVPGLLITDVQGTRINSSDDLVIALVTVVSDVVVVNYLDQSGKKGSASVNIRVASSDLI